MFEGALNRGPQARARFGTGAFLSAAFHVAVLGGALLLSSGEREVDPPEPDFKGPVAIPVNLGRPASQIARRAPARAAVQPRRQRILMPARVRSVEPQPEVTPRPAPDLPLGNEAPTAVEQSGPPGDGQGTCEGIDCVEATACEGEGCGGEEQVRIFTSDMAPPVRLEGRAPQYTRAALEARVEGLTIVKCVIPRSGIPERCRIVKPLPYLDQAVLDAISTWRYRPATLGGVPVAVDYILRVNVQLPR